MVSKVEFVAWGFPGRKLMGHQSMLSQLRDGLQLSEVKPGSSILGHDRAAELGGRWKWRDFSFCLLQSLLAPSSV